MFGHEKLPLVINIGEIKTSSINLKVKFAGLDSLLFEDLCKVNKDSAAKDSSSAAISNPVGGINKSKSSIFQGTVNSKDDSEDRVTPANKPTLKVIEADELNTELGRMEVSSSNFDTNSTRHNTVQSSKDDRVEESIIELA